MPSNFWKILDELRSSVSLSVVEPVFKPAPGFPIHPSASELAESMLQDPEALVNETYEPGLYDEEGDYYPQYSDDPSRLPDYIAPNPLGDTAPESVPASEPASQSDGVDTSSSENVS